MKRLSAPTYAELYYRSAAAVAEGQQPAVAANFLRLLRRHRALKLMPRILVHLQRLDDQAHQLTRVAVTASRASDITTLESQLTNRLGPVVLDSTIDRRLRGGLVLRVGDTASDGSLRTRLSKLHDQLTDDTHA